MANNAFASARKSNQVIARGNYWKAFSQFLRLLDRGMKCVETMQSNCRKLDLPFEVMIQAPKKSQLVQELFAESENGVEMEARSRKTRSTVSVYQPEEDDKVTQPKATTEAEPEKESQPEKPKVEAVDEAKEATTPEMPVEPVSGSTEEASEPSTEEATTQKEDADSTTTKGESNTQIKRFALYDERDFAKRDTDSDKNGAAALAEDTSDVESVGAANPTAAKTTAQTAPAKAAEAGDTNVGAPLLFPPILPIAPLLAVPFANLHLHAINDHIFKAHALLGAHLAKIGIGAPLLLGAQHAAGTAGAAAIAAPAHVATHLAAAHAKLAALTALPRLAAV